ncbi:hypothetical protein DFH07DRAFT_785620 [Mycena maculata]|uniref:Uncharacterized protein n=1 Tax=Mycena maculata TaxID=230809 RepID=A0AAD7H9M1_9AGAR|nr:hypothetical protein DFH07DRAFT_785620 [Mycena maculata]
MQQYGKERDTEQDAAVEKQLDRMPSSNWTDCVDTLDSTVIRTFDNVHALYGARKNEKVTLPGKVIEYITIKDPELEKLEPRNARRSVQSIETWGPHWEITAPDNLDVPQSRQPAWGECLLSTGSGLAVRQRPGTSTYQKATPGNLAVVSHRHQSRTRPADVGAREKGGPAAAARSHAPLLGFGVEQAGSGRYRSCVCEKLKRLGYAPVGSDLPWEYKRSSTFAFNSGESLDVRPQTGSFEQHTPAEAQRNPTCLPGTMQGLARLRDRERKVLAIMCNAIVPANKLCAELLVENFLLLAIHRAGQSTLEFTAASIAAILRVSQLKTRPSDAYLTALAWWLDRSSPFPIRVSVKSDLPPYDIAPTTMDLRHIDTVCVEGPRGNFVAVGRDVELCLNHTTPNVRIREIVLQFHAVRVWVNIDEGAMLTSLDLR